LLSPNIEIASVTITGSNSEVVVTIEDVEYIEIKNMKSVEYLPDKIGFFFPKLGYLSVENTNLKNISRSNFKGMEKLWTVSFNKNQLTNLNEDLFEDVPNLILITFDDNKIRSIPLQLLVNLKQLGKFQFTNSLIENIQSDLFINNKELWKVDLKNNRLKTIELDFRQLKNLQNLEFEGNICINKNAANADEIPKVQSIIESNCTLKV